MHEVFDAFAAVMRSLPPDPEIREAFIFAAWRRVAGGLLCEHAAPARVEGDLLHVAVSSFAWQRHLADLSAQMVFKLNAILGSGSVRRIEFDIDEEYVIEQRRNGGDRIPDNEFIELAESESAGAVTESANAIDDESLRNAFLLAAGRCLARRAKYSEAKTP